MKWSNPNTWPNKVIPGQGSMSGKDAIIPCNVNVILDVPTLTFDKLIINGWLKVQDNRTFQVFANFVVVQGRLTIGTPLEPYPGKILFNLTGGSYDHTVSQGSITNTIGTRAFAVVGGLVEMNGMYGNQKSWTVLKQTAWAGAYSIYVTGNVTSWPVGGTIAIASTDFDYKQAETRIITAVYGGWGGTTIVLDQPLSYMHWGNPLYTGIPGVYMDESAEVSLLTRSIVIQGHPNPIDPLIGGHFIVVQTPIKQSIIGIELVNMGQQGNLGRYPMHLHLCQSLAGMSIQKISVHDSNQRCIVVHGTWDVTIDNNVAYKAKGHCIIVEDGIEKNNTFSNNLAFYTEPVQRLIPSSQGGAIESDDAPSTFWIANPNNHWLGNVAAGGFDTGYWFQLAGQVLGPSARFPSAAGVYPHHTVLGTFDGNVAHSYTRTGLRTYSDGYRPRQDGGVGGEGNPINAPAVDITFKNFRAYKNAMDGMFIHETDSLIIDGAMMADNAVLSIELHQVEHCIVQNSIILGETANIGNPSQCDQQGNEYANCRAISGCSFPVASWNARSVGGGQTKRNGAMFGILIDQSEYPTHGLAIDGHSRGAPYPQHIRNVTFGFFSNACRVQAAITANGHTQNALFSSGHSSSNLKFLDNSPKIYMAPRREGILGFETPSDAGPIADVYVFRDEDGSLIGGNGGYVVTNTNALLPNTTACQELPGSNGYACRDTCYRSVAFTLRGMTSNPTYTITRVKDGVSFQLNGYSSTTFLNLLTDSPYKIQIDPMPESVNIWYGDPEGCIGSVIILLVAPKDIQWASSGASWSACAGSLNDLSKSVQMSYVCSNGSPAILKLLLGASSRASVTLKSTPGSPSCTLLQCGILAAKSSWLYGDSNLQLPNPQWAASSYGTATWRTGKGVFGFGAPGVDTPIIKSSGDQVVWYFKTTFGFKKLSCVSKLKLGVMVNDGVLVYINGREIYRKNMPTGAITSATEALSGHQWEIPEYTEATFNASSISLITGVNTLAVEVHSVKYGWNVRFDMWLTALGNCSPTTFYR